MHATLLILIWLIALAWLTKVLAAARGLPTVPDLLDPQHDCDPTGAPSLTVIVPARNEAAHIRACLESLLAQDYPQLHILAVDDRSTDDTGTVMDTLAASHTGRLQVLHIDSLPEGWLGKTHAMALAADLIAPTQQPSDYLLFTDADVLYRPDALRRALAHAVALRADHFVLAPTMLIRRWDEGLLLGFFQIFGLWGPRPWRVADPDARRDAIGIGAFNMLRRSAYDTLGGLAPQRMDIVEDLTLARRVKQARLRQRFAFGQGLVSVHWAAGASGLIRVMTKNVFSAFRFRIPLLIGACLWLAVFCLSPVAALGYSSTRLPALIALTAVAGAYRLYGRHSGIATWNALFFPIGAILFTATLLRSMLVTLRNGGVEWRGTFYPLAELRRLLSPIR